MYHVMNYLWHCAMFKSNHVWYLLVHFLLNEHERDSKFPFFANSSPAQIQTKTCDAILFLEKLICQMFPTLKLSNPNRFIYIMVLYEK